MAIDPILIHLPFWLADRGFALERLLAQNPTMSWSRAWSLLPKFELSGPEQLFARTLLARKRNIWLFRCNQHAFCGDFAAIDMSEPRRSWRRPLVIELKAGAPLGLDGRGAAGQLRNAREVADELERRGLSQGPAELVSGGEQAILTWLGAE